MHTQSTTYSYNQNRYNSRQNHHINDSHAGENFSQNDAKIPRGTEFQKPVTKKLSAPLPISSITGNIICALCKEPIKGLVSSVTILQFPVMINFKLAGENKIIRK